MAGKWPDDIIDGERLYEMLGLELVDPSIIGEDAYQKVLDFETAIDNAHLRGQIKRFSAKDPRSGAIVGHGYRRAEVLKFARNGPWAGLAASVRAAQAAQAETPADDAPVPAGETRPPATT